MRCLVEQSLERTQAKPAVNAVMEKLTPLTLRQKWDRGTIMSDKVRKLVVKALTEKLIEAGEPPAQAQKQEIDAATKTAQTSSATM